MTKQPQTRLALVLPLSLLTWVGALAPVCIRTAAAAAAEGASSDMMLLEQESKFEREKTQYLQENVLDKILGPGKAVVIVDVEMGLETRNAEMAMGKSKLDKQKNLGEDNELQP